MHFDTFEAFSRAAYRHAGLIPVSVHDEFDPVLLRAIRAGNKGVVKDLSALARVCTGMLVKLMNSCYHVHETAVSHSAPGDDLLGYRLEQARESLIPGWQLVIQVSNGNIIVMLFDDQDRQQSFPSLRESLSGQVGDAALYAERGPERQRRARTQHTEDPDHGDHLGPPFCRAPTGAGVPQLGRTTSASYNWRYVAYCEALGRDPEEQLAHDALRWPGGPMVGFMLWMQKLWRTHLETARFVDHQQFDLWLAATIGGQ